MCGKMLKYLWVYSADNQWVDKWHHRLIKRRIAKGYDVVGFCTTPDYLNNRHWLSFPELDERWQRGDYALLKMYEQLVNVAKDKNVLILYNGANLHPAFIKMLNIFKVYTAGDDPESTEILTKPVAEYFDMHLINNIACIDMYKSWGLKHVCFWPLGSLSFKDDCMDIDERQILNIKNRNIDIAYFGEYQSMKKVMFDTLVNNFPEAYCRGRNWPGGFIEWKDMWNIYRHSQIGWNVHNSTGPINFRTYELPAYGIMQICDNKSGLGKIYDLGKEAIGFDTVEECIEQTRYYLDHKKEQREIALAGWNKWKDHYHPDAVWEKLVKHVGENYNEICLSEIRSVYNKISIHRTRTAPKRIRYKLGNIKNRLKHKVKSNIIKMLKR